MISRKNRIRKANVLATGGLMLFVLCFFTDGIRAEERKFVVMMAHSPKAFVTNGVPGRPPGGLTDVEIIRKDYFDVSDDFIDSFAEYWEEISYRAVTIATSSAAFEWISLPWAIEPNGPNHPARNSPADYIDLFSIDGACANPSGGRPVDFSYGAGEVYCDCFGTGDNSPDVSRADCGALVIIDLVGDPNPRPFEPERGGGLNDKPAVGINVWTPGERFVDVDGDMRWDGIDEKNDMMCHGPHGCRDICSAMICENGLTYCTTEADCPQGVGCKRGSLIGDRPCNGDNDCGGAETCGDAFGSGPRGCDTPGCGDLFMPCINFNEFDNDDECGNPNGDDPFTDSGCTPPNFIACTTDTDCRGSENGRCRLMGSFGETVGLCDPRQEIPCTGDAPCANQTCDTDSGFCAPESLCYLAIDLVDLELPECCAEDLETDPLAMCADGGGVILCSRFPSNGSCNPLPEGIVCGTPRQCCEFDDVDASGTLSVVEPFEDFLVRWSPAGGTPGSVWTALDRKYIKDNYPGDVPALLARVGNGYYDPPDLFYDHLDGNGAPEGTKMMQDAGASQFTWVIPKPGSDPAYVAKADEPTWFDSWWIGRYGSAPPAWPGNGNPANPGRNGVRMRAFDPAAPNPPTVGSATDRRWFRASTGGWNSFGRGTQDERQLQFDLGGNEWDNDILPEEEFGYYDGWVEHDDLASSRYHKAGDERLGEVTSPVRDRGFDNLPLIFGDDLGPHDPTVGSASGDNRGVAAGPGAINIHGEKGYDAGDVCLVEWLTWRRDGTSRTVGSAWESEHPFGGPAARYHPFATPASVSNGYRPTGQCDTIRVVCVNAGDCPAGESCNRTLQAIGFRDYNLDGMIDQGEVRPELSANYSVDSNPNTPNNGTGSNYPFNRSRLTEDVVEALDPSVAWINHVDNGIRPGNRIVSGIVIVPSGSYTNINRFPTAPGLNWPIHTEDAGVPLFSDLVICENCRDEPSAISYAAHEYLHSWEGYPDLYDYDVFDEPGTSIINCPIGVFDIMAGSRGSTEGLVHPVPPLKARSGWIQTVDLRSVLTPGVVTTLTLPPAEFNPNNSYFFLENSERSGERFYFWSAGSGFDRRMPGEGLLILKTNDFRANFDALALQQRTDPFNFRIVQADDRNDLIACSSTGNSGDAGDMWPGSTNATTFNFGSNPPATWQENNHWTGLDITDIRPDGLGSTRVTLSWVPTNIPGLRFIDPPGGESVGLEFDVLYDVTDIDGGTDILLYYTNDNTGTPSPASATQIGATRKKNTPRTVRFTEPWNVSVVPDGRYFLFAKLVPGLSVGGALERSATDPRAGRNNVGNGAITSLVVDVSLNINSTSRSETWVLECIDPDGQEWRVNSSLTQPLPDDPADNPFALATTCPENQAVCTSFLYESLNGEVKFVIKEGSSPFTLGDRFTFTTTGITDFSQGLSVIDGEVSSNPIAVIDIDPDTPLSGRPPLTVGFDARRSTDPEGLPLTFEWDFGDGAVAIGPEVIHEFRLAGTFTVILTARNSFGQPGEATVDVNVINNSPTAVISATPSNGPAPRTVQFGSIGSNDLETPISDLIFQWDFGDGRGANSLGLPGEFQTTEHFYSEREDGTVCSSADPCTFNAILTVTDTGGKSDTDTIAILVGNSSPIPSVTVSRTSGTSPLTVIFNAILSTDPDEDDIEIIWEFEEGTFTPTTGRYSVSGPPGVTNGEVIHEYTQAGTYQPKAILSDGRGLETMWTGPSINVAAPQEGSSDPIADFELIPEPPYEIGQEFTVKSNSRDPDTSPSLLTHVWNFGDGSPEVSGLEREVTHAYAIAPAAGQSGFTISLVVTDPEDHFGRRTRLVQVVQELPDDDGGDDDDDDGDELENQPPTALFVVNTNGDPVAAGSPVQFDASGSTDPEGGVLNFRWDFGDGSRAEAGFGNVYILRTHTYAEPGTYTVLLTVSDEFNASADAVQQITVLSSTAGNRPPVPILVDGPRVGAAPFTVQLDGRLSFDPDNDPLTFIWEFSDENGVIETFEEDGFITRTFETVGTYMVVMKVDDGERADDEELPFVTDEILVTAAPDLPDPVDPGQGVPDDDPPAGSHTQRPSSVPCGFGMLMGLFVSLLGLSVMRLQRRRRGFVRS